MELYNIQKMTFALVAQISMIPYHRHLEIRRTATSFFAKPVSNLFSAITRYRPSHRGTFHMQVLCVSTAVCGWEMSRLPCLVPD